MKKKSTPGAWWPDRAQALGAKISRQRMHPAVVAWAEARPAAEGWAIAFSGGADSLALLLLLWAHWPGRRARLRALHFDHRLRGAAARADASFCRRVCRAIGIGLITGAWTRASGSASEAEAREARLKFFAAAMKRHRLHALWLGHQQDDIAESLLMRLARGSGAAGLAAPRPVQNGPFGRVHLRPLLELKKAEIVAALGSAGIGWREDRTNRKNDFFRNRIRRSVLPSWVSAAGRDAVAGAACSRALLEEDDLALEAWADSLSAITPGRKLRLVRVFERPRAVVRRVLHRWLLAQAVRVELSRRGFAALLEAVQRGRPTRQSLGDGFAVIRGDWLCYERRR